MKTISPIVCLILAGLFTSITAWAADEAAYDSSTGILTIPKVKVDTQYVYDASLKLNEQGLFAIIGYSTNATSGNSTFTLSSEAVVNGELLDAYKCEEKTSGVEKSIPLSWSNVPSGTGSLAVIMHHYPNPDDTSNANSYLLLWGINPQVTAIPYGEADEGTWYMGANKDGNAISYTSPCSPSSGTHEYTITLYALSETPTALPNSSSVEVTYEVLKSAIESVTTIATASLTFNDVTP